jgi:hypothetical protein
VDCPEGSKNYRGSETLQDSDYCEFVQKLAADGFEVTWHGATMESSDRRRTETAIEKFKEVFGFYPRIHVNHGYNKENIYWGSGRVDSWWISKVYEKSGGWPAKEFLGHDPASQYWWGDYCEKFITYARNLSFNELNIDRTNPSMPYSDPKRPLAPRWFSSADAGDVESFVSLVSEENLDRLCRDGGFSIISTHFGKGFVKGGQVDPRIRSIFERLATMPGWFPNAGELLDWLWDQRQSKELPAAEWKSMQRRWLLDLLSRHIRRKS